MRADLPDPREEFGPDIWDEILFQLAVEAFRILRPDGYRICRACGREELQVLFREGGIAELQCQGCGSIIG